MMEGNIQVNGNVQTSPLDVAYIISFGFPHPKEVPQIQSLEYRKRIAGRFAELLNTQASNFGFCITNLKIVKNGKNPTVHLITSMPREIVEAILKTTETPPNSVYKQSIKQKHN